MCLCALVRMCLCVESLFDMLRLSAHVCVCVCVRVLYLYCIVLLFVTFIIIFSCCYNEELL